LVCRHFSRCKTETCTICKPVKEFIHNDRKRTAAESMAVSPSSSSESATNSPEQHRTPKRLCSQCSKHFVVQERSL
jgi:hypothetical protein